MKEYYDQRRKVDSKVYPKVGEGVYMRVQGEKALQEHPKLSFGITGPFRVLETSENSALITEIGSNREPLRIQFDLLLRIPEGLEGVRIDSKKQRGKKG